jgi:hypothetical protein
MPASLRTRSMPTATTAAVPSLYDVDRVAWLDDTVARIVARRRADLDYYNIRRFLLYWASRDKKEVRDRLTRLLNKLLPFEIGQKRITGKQHAAILHQQFELSNLLESPTLARVAQRILPEAYRSAALKLGRPARAKLPETCPFQLNDLLNTDWEPGTLVPNAPMA